MGQPDEPMEQSDSQIRLVVTIARSALSGNLDALSRELTAENTSISAGHQYTEIDDRCPDCETKLEITRVQPDTENGAHASTRCPADDCEWTGTAIYRLIDLAHSGENAPDSTVANGETVPEYHPY